MTISSAIILGIVQGVAEFLPISSSGHLAVLQNLFDLSAGEDHLFFDVLLHLGTLISICVCYWGDIVAMVREVFIVLRGGRRADGTPVQGHLFCALSDGTTVELRLIEGGYVGYQELGWYFVKMPGDVFDAVLAACQ